MSLQRDFRKVENLVNRGLVLIRHLELILNEVTRKARAIGQSVRVDNSARLYDVLHSCNAFLKSLSDVLEGLIRIHESTKEQIAEFEKRMQELISGNMLRVFGSPWRPYHSQAELEESFKRNCLRPAKDEEEKIIHIGETIYERFIKFHLGMGESTLSYLSDRPRNIFEQGELQNEWIYYSKKFAGVIETLYRILKGDEAVEEYVEKELEKTYRILSDGDTSKLYPVTKSVSENTARVIAELEKAYDQM